MEMLMELSRLVKTSHHQRLYEAWLKNLRPSAAHDFQDARYTDSHRL